MTTTITNTEKRAIGLVLFGALLLRLYTLGSESFWLDEAIVWDRVKEGPLSFLFDWDADTQGPVYPMFIWIWSKLFGFSEVALRTPSVIFGVLSIHAIYLLGRRLFSHTAAMWAAVFAAVNPFLIYYSQEARPYALWLWTSLLAIWYLHRLMEHESKVNRNGFIGFTLVSLYTHPYGPFLLAILGMMVITLSPKTEWRKYYKIALIIGIAYIPEALVFLNEFIGKIENKWSVAAWISRPTHRTPFEYMRYYFAWDKLATACAVMIIGGLIWQRKLLREYRVGLIVCLAIAAGFFALPWLVSQIAPILWMRYTITVVASILLVLGWVIAQIKKPLQYIAAVLVLGNAFPLYHYYVEYDKDPWRQAVEWLAPQVKAEDRFIIHPLHAPLPLEYYLRDLHDHEVVIPRGETKLADVMPDTGTVWFAAATYSHSKPMREAVYAELSRTCDCDSTYKTAALYTKNPFRIFMADIEITRCRAKPVQPPQSPH